MSNLAPNIYFVAVRKEMERIGFTFFSQVAIDQNDRPDHVGSTISRITSLFFHIKGKNLILQLCLHEHNYYSMISENPEKIRSFWDVRVYLAMLPNRELFEKLYIYPDERVLGGGSDEIYQKKVPLYDTEA